MTVRYLLTVEPVPGGGPPELRLRRLLKALLRNYGFRLVELAEAPADGAPAAGALGERNDERGGGR